MKRYESTTFAKKNLNINAIMIKIIVNLKTIVMILVNTEVPNKAYVI